MRITKETLGEMFTRDGFKNIFAEYAMAVLGEARLFPRLSLPRIYDAQGAWQSDLTSLREREPLLGDGPDHFKQCGHLAFWLRRLSPVVEVADLDFGSSDIPMTKHQHDFRELLFGYCNEFLAFDLGYQICRYYEANQKEKPSERARSLLPSPAYCKTVCHFIKFKTVSPDAMHLIYKSLFYYNGMDE
jgi:hypothetical protein